MAKKNSGKKRDKQQKDTAAKVAGARGGAAAAADGGELQVELDEARQKIGQLEQELAGAKDRHLRAVAELDNYKRRTGKEKIELSGHVKAGVFSDIIGLVDNFERFFQHVEDGGGDLDESFVQGVELIHKSLQKVLEKHGVEPINETGVPVDYNLHQGLMIQPVDDQKQDQSVVEILEVGYRIGDKLIRPAKVKVAEFGG